MDRSTITWYDDMRRTLGLVEFFMPFPSTGHLGVGWAINEIRGVAVTRWHEKKAGSGAIQLFGFASLVDGALLGEELDALHGDVQQALESLDSGPQYELIQNIREAASWPSHFEVARHALEAFEHVAWFLGEGVGSAQRNMNVCARLEAEGMARHAEDIEGAQFLYGFGRLFGNRNDWKNRLHAEMVRLQREDRARATASTNS